MLSSTRSAKRRSSSRAMPGPPRQTWYCSVSLRRKRTRATAPSGGAAAFGGRSAGGRAVGGRGRVWRPGRGGLLVQAGDERAGALHHRDERVVVDRAGGGHHDVL